MRGSLEKRGRSSWRVRVYIGADPVTGTKRTVSRTVVGSKRDAEDVLNRLLLEAGDGRHLASGLTVGDLLDQWWPMKRPTLSPTTARDWDSCLRLHVRPHVEGMPLHKFRAMDMDRYKRLGEAGVGPQRVRRVHTILSTALGQAVRWEMIAANPALSASPPEVRERQVQPPSPAVVAAFYEGLEADDADLAMFVWLASFTGARRGELCALRWADIDLLDGSLLISRALVDGGGTLVEKDTKTHQSRRIALGHETVAKLVTYHDVAIERAAACGTSLRDEAFVFTNAVDGATPWWPDSVTHRFIRARRQADLPEGLRLHDLRHFLATRMISSGIDVRTVSGRLGHRRTSTTTDRYAAFVPAADRAAAAAFEEAFLA
ncbi:MAG TPA: tyrosine-type recombinase/integrase [Acidimicrobiales bacterium]|nr:tyrosine-type recombinase/integrase [Acidimicrobiales bacterium]